jgi:rare lipoprotein A
VKLVLATLLLLGLVACGGAQRPGAAGGATSTGRVPAARGATQTGYATYYGDRFHGRKTASGERFDQHELTAAHRTLPFGTTVRVTNRKNGRQVIVRINDRGPWGGRGRIIDVSKTAARQLGMLRDGVVPVIIEVLDTPRRER